VAFTAVANAAPENTCTPFLRTNREDPERQAVTTIGIPETTGVAPPVYGT